MGCSEQRNENKFINGQIVEENNILIKAQESITPWDNSKQQNSIDVLQYNNDELFCS